MRELPDRAVCLALRGASVLVVRRYKDGRSYCVLPGGGVEPGEQPAAAALRELAEETGLAGAVRRHLATVRHPDRVAHYFLVDVEEGPLVLGGPEAENRSAQDRYSPEWLPVERVEADGLQPEGARELVRAAARSA